MPPAPPSPPFPAPPVVPVPPREEPAPTPPEEAKKDDAAGRGDRIGVTAMDESVARVQLAARWAEAYAPTGDDSMDAALRRFQRAYVYLDSVMHGIEPAE